MKPPVIEVKDLSVIRGDELVIKDATFTINRGDYVGIVGPNGGGKTSLLLTLLGILPPEKGAIRLFGEDISSFSQWERIAHVSQDATNFDVNFPLTVRELVSLGRIQRSTIGRKLRRDDWKAVDETLHFMGIKNIAHRRIGELSGGQKQRVFVAKALVRNPDIIFLDEPVTGVDAETQERFYKKLSDLNIARGTTIMIVSHDLAAVFCRMSKVMCVNREVHMAEITEELEPDTILKKVYGEHFHFVFHRHQCSGVFERE